MLSPFPTVELALESTSHSKGLFKFHMLTSSNIKRRGKCIIVLVEHCQDSLLIIISSYNIILY